VDDTTVYIANQGANTNSVTYDFNAYTNSSNPFTVGGAHDLIVTNGFNWQSSLLGNYYLPSNSQLVNHGSTTADLVGLYCYTTQTNQVEETNSPVDIGYHYVAVDQYGVPLDSNANGIPDWWEFQYLGGFALTQNDSYGVPYVWYFQNGFNPQSIGNDPDYDGLLNYQEYLYGTKPQVSEGFSIWTTAGNSNIP
jgi:hypothetical protein